MTKRTSRPDAGFRRGVAAIMMVAVTVFLPAAGEAGDAPAEADLAVLKDAFQRPAEIPFPADNPFSEAKAELGKILFFDHRLSGGQALSCASCHNPGYGWEDGRRTAVGDGMKPLGRHSPTVLNLAYNDIFFWDGRADTLEEQARGPMTAPAEMNQSIEGLMAVLNGIPGYRPLFDAAFPGEGLTVDNVFKAIATYERTIVSAKAPFDAWVEGDADAMSDAAKRGFALFTDKAGCSSCHAGWSFTDQSFHDIGLPDDSDPGRGKLFADTVALQHAFKTPGLRNVERRAPFMHNGSVPSLEAVVEHYATGLVERPSLSPGLPRINLTKDEVADIVAFLKTLTSNDAPVTVPAMP